MLIKPKFNLETPFRSVFTTLHYTELSSSHAINNRYCYQTQFIALMNFSFGTAKRGMSINYCGHSI